MFSRFWRRDATKTDTASAQDTSAATTSTGTTHGGGEGGATEARTASPTLTTSSGSLPTAAAAAVTSGNANTNPGELRRLDPSLDEDLIKERAASQERIICVTIPHYRVRNTYVEYVVECTTARCGHDDAETPMSGGGACAEGQRFSTQAQEPAPSAWRVHRRYQQFKALDHALKQLCGRSTPNHCGYGVLPVLPGSHWMEVTNQSAELVDKRRKYLEIYLQQLLVPRNHFDAAYTHLYIFLREGAVPVGRRGVTHSLALRPLLGFFPFHDDVSRKSTRSIDDASLSTATATNVLVGGAAAAAAAQEGAILVHSLPVQSSTTTLSADSRDSRKAGVTQDTEDTVERDKEDELPVSPTHNKQSLDVGEVAAYEYGGYVLHICHLGENDGANEQKCDGDGGGGGGDCRVEEEETERGCGPSSTGSTRSSGATPATMSLSSPLPLLTGATGTCCVYCNAQFSRAIRPRHCYYCRARFCRRCLWRLSLRWHSSEEDGAAITGSSSSTTTISGNSAAAGFGESMRSPLDEGGCVVACEQCTENYKRRLDRCVELGGGNSGVGSIVAALSQGSADGVTQAVLGDSGTQGEAGSSTQRVRVQNMALCTPSTLRATLPVSPGITASGGNTEVIEFLAPLSLGSAATGGSSAHTPAKLLSGTSSPFPFVSGSQAGGGVAPLVSLDDLQFITVIGRGSFGKVYKVRLRSTGAIYALKVLDKAAVHKRCMTSYVKEEKTILTMLPPHPYVLYCHYAFQTRHSVFFILDFLPGGELFGYIYPTLRLTPDAVRLYVAELVLAIEHLHQHDVAHRDIKPENIILGADGHIHLTDFGLARRHFSRARRRSLVGSAEYLAPETIHGEPQTTALDWWSLGVVLYELLSGVAPFHASSTNAVYDNVLTKEVDFSLTGPDGSPCFTSEARLLVSSLLERDVSKRLQRADLIKAHPYFASDSSGFPIDWEALKHKGVPAPVVPDVLYNDTRYAKRHFTAEWATLQSPANCRKVSNKSLDMLTRCFDNFPLASEGSLPVGKLGDAATQDTASDGDKWHASYAHHCLHRYASSVDVTLELLLGTWRPLCVETCAEDGRVTYPWGGDVAGMLMYTSGGHYSMQLSPAGKGNLVHSKPLEMTREELMDTYCLNVVSGGTFELHFESQGDDAAVDDSKPRSRSVVASGEVRGACVTHCCMSNVCPNSVGTRLTLSCEMAMVAQNTEPVVILTTPWCRVPGESFYARTVVTWGRME